MPRPSLNPEKARTGGGGIEAGNYEVVAAKFQNIKTDYRPNQLNMLFDLATLDKDGDRVRGADPVEMHLSFGQKSLEAFHPGQGKNQDDDDPQDMTDAVDAEGNTIFCKGNEQFSASCAALVFQKSLTALGFPKELQDKCWAPAYTGLKFSLDTLDPKTLNDRLKLRLNTKPMKDEDGQERAVTYKIATKWLNPNYLTSGTSANGAKSSASAAPAATSPEEIAAACIRKVAVQRAGPKNAIKTKQSLAGFATNAFATGKYKANLADVRKFFEDDDWIAAQVAEIGGEMDFNDDGAWTGKVTFPAAS